MSQYTRKEAKRMLTEAAKDLADDVEVFVLEGKKTFSIKIYYDLSDGYIKVVCPNLDQGVGIALAAIKEALNQKKNSAT